MSSVELLAEMVPKAFRVEMDIDTANGIVRLAYCGNEWSLMFYSGSGPSRDWSTTNGKAEVIAKELRLLGLIE